MVTRPLSRADIMREFLARYGAELDDSRHPKLGTHHLFQGSIHADYIPVRRLKNKNIKVTKEDSARIFGGSKPRFDTTVHGILYFLQITPVRNPEASLELFKRARRVIAENFQRVLGKPIVNPQEIPILKEQTTHFVYTDKGIVILPHPFSSYRTLLQD